MKHMFLIAVLSVTVAAYSQNNNPADTKAWVDAKNYIFTAQFASPQSGLTRPLTSTYELTVRPDSVEAFLPFFGRAYSAPIGQTDGGIKFTSAKFDYKTVKRKKNSWEITIRPRDITDVQQLNLSVFDNGTANLRVTSTNRQPISFTGYVTEGRPLNKKAF
jgi:hypothetical protein